MNHIKLLTAVAATALLAAPAAVAQTTPAHIEDARAPAVPPVSSENVIEVLKMHGRFTTLLQALDQAQLTDTLATNPRITLFAPTDQAFAALPDVQRERLLNPANAQELRNLMLYHVLVADLRPDQIMGARGPIATAGGIEVDIDGTGETIMIDAARVTDPAIDVANGNIYVIDRLLNPNAVAQGDMAPGDDTPPPTTHVEDRDGMAAGHPEVVTPPADPN